MLLHKRLRHAALIDSVPNGHNQLAPHLWQTHAMHCVEQTGSGKRADVELDLVPQPTSSTGTEQEFHAGDAVYSSLVKRIWSCTHGTRTDPQHTTALKEL